MTLSNRSIPHRQILIRGSLGVHDRFSLVEFTMVKKNKRWLEKWFSTYIPRKGTPPSKIPKD